jgi:23S rRNA A2030 N6-methylase RlmJ
MAAAGLLIANPPFGFDTDMQATLDMVAPRLGHNSPAKTRLDWLAGAD